MTQLVSKYPSASFVTMTKELVDELLSLNTKNRNKRDLTISAYKRAIVNNFWVPTNQGIGVSASGFLIDGQHRLEALRQSGYPPVLMLVVTGLPDEAMAAVDIGANRSARDFLQFAFDTKVSAFVSAILRTSMVADKNFKLFKFIPQEYAECFEKIGFNLQEVLKVDGIQKLPAPVVSALIHAHSKGWEDEVISFTKSLTTGEMLQRGNPVLVLRNWLQNIQGQGGSSAMEDRYKKTLRAVWAHIEGKPLDKLYGSMTEIPEKSSTTQAKID